MAGTQLINESTHCGAANSLGHMGRPQGLMDP